MYLNTTRFGLLEPDPERILEFPKGLPGFPECVRFHLFHEEKPDPLVHWLQSLEDPDVSLSVVDPSRFGLTYEIPLTDEETQLLELTPEDEVAVLLTLSRRDSDDMITPHVTIPLLINIRSRKGLQKQILGADYALHLKVSPSSA